MLLSSGSSFRPIELKRRFFSKLAVERAPTRQPLAPTDAHGDADPALTVAQLEHAALMSSAAAQLVLDGEGRLALCNHRAMHLFGLAARDVGRPIQDLEVSYRPVELRTHLSEALNARHTVWVRDVTMARVGSDPMFLDIQIIPLHDESGTPLGVTAIFNDVTEHRQLQNELLHTNRQLETAYEELQSTNEELETTNEELQSTVEELETTNEELQSTNEELETMNEELQSMNDEMQLSNEALREGQDEVDRLNRFMSAILGSMNAGVAVVDSEVRLLAWNGRAEDLWGVRSDEVVGSHLLNLDIGLPLEQLRPSIRRHLGDGQSDADEFLVDAVNRRGRLVQVKVTVSSIRDDASSGPAAMIVMDVIEALDGAEAVTGGAE
jgi:two-component system CheB/CheR fusion protein